ncbi:MAG: hypothetical protein OI74_11900 [Gammaproteobacteria bacterium (ex Lamellibrachia satsuma)]|nr:MAG: hypothetical protein OI74_11900 [Gammaproteobacteria bacterium (ex Lamellibrachia satsuma)]RRS33251.1 MAG: hypothetical protein NV67_16745 [Gammaproteobacteria bacterium (ex Lamellibrachia satsuma)]
MLIHTTKISGLGFDETPKAFNPVDMSFPASIVFSPVLDLKMIDRASIKQAIVDVPGIGIDDTINFDTYP